MTSDFNYDECTTILDLIFPYLFVACFLLGIYFSQIKRFFGFQNYSKIQKNERNEILNPMAFKEKKN